MEYKAVIFLALILVVNAEKLWSHNERYVYSYCGIITLGSRTSVKFITYSKFCGDLELLDDGDIKMKLSNATYEVFIPKERSVNPELLPVGEEYDKIELPFTLQYKNEHEIGITVMPEDKPWSRNIKVGLANLIYIPNELLDESKKDIEDSYQEYQINRYGKEIFLTRKLRNKLYDMKEAWKPKELNLQTLLRQEYHIGEDDGNNIIKQIRSNSNMVFSHLEGSGVNFYMNISQIVDFKFKDTKLFESPKYNADNFTKIGQIFKSDTVERIQVEQEDNIDIVTQSVKSDLEQINQEMNDKFLVFSDHKYYDMLNITERLLQRFKMLKTDDIKVIHNNIKNSSDKKIEQMLLSLMISSEKSKFCNYILDLIVGGQISENDAINYISKMTSMSEYDDLGEKLYNIVIDEKVNQKIRNACILPLIRFISEQDDENLFEKLMKSTQTWKKDEYSLLLINTLRDYYKDLVEETNNKDFSNLLDGDLGHLRNRVIKKQIKNLYNILLNQTQPFEVRAKTLIKLMDNQYLDEFNNIPSFVNDVDLNNLFWTRMKSYASTNMPHYQNAKLQAQKLMLNMKYYSKNPLLSSSHIYDFSNPENGNAAGFVFTHYGRPEIHKFITFTIDIWRKAIDFTSINEQLCFNLKWTDQLEAANFKTLQDFIKYPLKGVTLSFSLIRNDIVEHMEIIYLKDDDFIETIKNLIVTKLTSSISIDRSVYKEINIPNEMGVPILFFVESVDFVQKEIDFGKRINIKYGNDKYDVVGIMLYNPVSGTYQHVKRTKVMHLRVPINIQVSDITRSRFSAKIILPDGNFGAVTYAYNEVDLWDKSLSVYVRLSCKKCKGDHFDYEFSGERHSEFRTYLWENDGEHSGISCALSAFGRGIKLSERYWSQMLHKLLNSENTNDGESLIMRMFLKSYQLQDVMMMPVMIMNGAGIICKKAEDSTEIDLDFSKTTAVYFQVSKVRYISISYLLKNDKNIMNKIEFNMAHENTGPYTGIDVKGKTSPSNSFCLKGNETLKGSSVDIDYTIAMGRLVDDKCPETNIRIKGEVKKSHKRSFDYFPKFNKCITNPKYSLYECVSQLTEFPEMKYDIETKKFPKKFLTRILDYMIGAFSKNFQRKFITDTSMEPNTGKFSLKMNENDVDIKISTNEYELYFDNLLMKELPFPMSLIRYNSLIKSEKCMLCSQYCAVTTDYVMRVDGGQKYALKANDWSILSENCEDGVCLWNVTTKINSYGYLELRVDTEGDFAKLSAYEHYMIFELNNEKVSVGSEDYKMGNKIGYFIIHDMEQYPDFTQVLLYINNHDILISFSKNRVNLYHPEVNFKGYCAYNSTADIYV